MSRLEPTRPLRFGALTHQGYVRAENQDRMTHFHFSLGEVFIVADGMGGHSGGARAASLVIEGFESFLQNLPQGFTPRAALRAAARRTNAAICAEADSGDPATAKMGSTVVVLFVSPSQAFVGHVGDSRAYLFRSGSVTRLTRDHTLVQQLVDRHLLSEEEARDHPDSSILARAMGRRSDLDIEFSPNLTLEQGDGILLCSDGLSGYVDDAEIAAIIAGRQEPEAVAEALVDRALDGGGDDNVTVQYVELDSRLAAGQGRTLRSTGDTGSGERPSPPWQIKGPEVPEAGIPAGPQEGELARSWAPDERSTGDGGHKTPPLPAAVPERVPMRPREAQRAVLPPPLPRWRAWLPALVGAMLVLACAIAVLVLVSGGRQDRGIAPSHRRHPHPLPDPARATEPAASALPPTPVPTSGAVPVFH